MFYTGIYINNNSASIVIIEKILKSARKIYLISDIRKINTGTSVNALTNELKQIYSDDKFIRRKKVFSQSKRPPKTTWTPPVFIPGSEANSEEALSNIRNFSISIEGIIFENNTKWHKKELTPLRFGSNYHVNPDDMKKRLVKVCNSDRLQTDTHLDHTKDLQTNLNQTISTGSMDSDIIRALSLPVWFCECVRLVKRY